MRIIGITGGIGTGKSTILNLLREKYGAYIVETDTLAHSLMLPGESVYCRIVEKFGKNVLNEDETIDRGKLGQIVFQNKEQLEQLNTIVHPAVKQYILADIEQKRKEQSIEYYIIEAALLVEDGYQAICDELWYIYATQETRIQRLLDGRGGNRDKWLKIIANQSSENFYREHCDVIIDNSGTIEQTVARYFSKERL